MKKILLTLLFFFSIYLSSYALNEEEIFDEKEKILSLYSLSNNAIEIEKEILTRTNISVSLSKVGWNLEPDISENIKNVMNRLNLNYAMTTYSYLGIFSVIKVYRRLESQWFSYFHPIIDSDLLNMLKQKE
jgi:hypothetical protein